jgi:hypothetical protein
MHFEIISQIQNEETFASGTGIRELPGCGKSMAMATGGNGKGWLRSDFVMARYGWLSYTGMRLPESAEKSSKSSASWIKTMSKQHTFAVCIHNTDYEVSLELRKLYEVIADPEAEKLDQIRVIDESGKDYLYPRNYFVIVDLPNSIEKQVLHAA